MRYMVSWSYKFGVHRGLSGNKTFANKIEADIFVRETSFNWRSYSIFTYEEGRLITDLNEVKHEFI